METPTHSPILEPLEATAPRKSIARAGLLTIVLLAATGGFAYQYSTSTSAVAAPQTAAAVESQDYFSGIELIGKAAIVVDIKTGKTLYQQNADAQLPLASLTKVMTALAVAEVLPQERILTIPYDTAPSENGQRLRKGERWSVKNILDYTLIASSNEGAQILASAADAELHTRYADSPAEASLWRMNQLAKELGLSGTYFLNVSGLDESTTQAGAYGSAHDMAKLFSYAASAQSSLFAATAEDGEVLMSEAGKSVSPNNTNVSQGEILGLMMGKTGLTDLAGGNLAVVFDVGLAHPVVAVILGSTKDGRFQDIQKLVAAARQAVAGE